MFRFKRKPGTPTKPRPARGVFKSKFEKDFNKFCDDLGYKLGYETTVLPFTTPPQARKYYPDWTIKPGWFIETKGRLVSADRKKLTLIRDQHPEARILIVFQRPFITISKSSKTTYAVWANKNKLEWCDIQDRRKILSFLQEATT